MKAYKLRDPETGLFKVKGKHEWGEAGDIYRTLGIAKTARAGTLKILKMCGSPVKRLEIVEFDMVEVEVHP